MTVIRSNWYNYFVGFYKDLILLNEEDQNNIYSPVIKKFYVHDRNIILYGEKHTKDTLDPDYQKFNEIWNIFVSLKDNKIIFVENFIPPEKENESIDEYIQKYGFQGFVTNYANQDNIEVACAEPVGDQINFFLQEEYGINSNDLSFVSWIFLNSLYHYLKRNKTISADYLNNVKRLFSNIQYDVLRKFIFKNTHILLPSIFEDLKEASLNIDSIKESQDPFMSKTEIQKVGYTVNIAREFWFLVNLFDKSKGFKNVLFTVGCNHILNQEPVWDKIKTSKKLLVL